MDDLENSPEPRRNVEQIVKASKRASDLVKQILAFSRKTAAGKNTLMLTPLIKETCKLLRSTVPTTIKMELDFHARNDTILGDPAQIQQVLMNLATNAVYEMRERGGTLTIALSDLAFLRQDTMPDADMKPGRYVKLSVKDTGDGMTEEVQKRVFEPFFTTKGAGLGTGMGLAVVYGIVKNHGGAVTLVSNPGEGAVFTIFLPFFDAVIEEEPETISEVPHGSERILLVDDEPQVVATVSQTLRRLGYKVVGNTNSRKALNTFINHPERFDLVITDQAMPESHGCRSRQEHAGGKERPAHSPHNGLQRGRFAGEGKIGRHQRVRHETSREERAGRDGAADAGQQGRRFCRIEVEYLPPRELSLISLKVSDDRSHVLGAY